MTITQVDLRSDTVTKPTPQMRNAMANAEVGDDLYREDPTVAKLEAIYAERVGKEAALFVPSGVMANQIAIRCHAQPGSWVAAGRYQHVVVFEYGGSARNAGTTFYLLDDESGSFGGEAIQEATSSQGYWDVQFSLICLENTHMPSGGRIWPIERLESVRQAASGLAIHMDGARLFNAEVASGVAAATFASYADSVMTCVSKGLAAPVGSLLAGSSEFIERARYERGVLGGQMRQVGVLAAAGIVALETMVDRLAEDHARARHLSEAVKARFGSYIGEDYLPETNIIVFDHPQADAISTYLNSQGVLVNPIGPRKLRFVTHKDVDDSQLDYAYKVIVDIPDDL